MIKRQVRYFAGFSTGNPQDVPLSQLSQELATYGNYQPSRKVFLNPSINPSGGKCEEVEMAYETFSNGTLKIYFNSSSSVSSGTYQVVIDE